MIIGVSMISECLTLVYQFINKDNGNPGCGVLRGY